MKPLTREQELQVISFLANSEELATLATARLDTRMVKRNQVLADLAAQLPEADKHCASALAVAAAAAAELAKARSVFARAESAAHQARIHSDGCHTSRESLKATAYRHAADLADPRIDDLRRWVLRLHNLVRAEPLEEVVRTGSGFGSSTFRTPGVPADKSAAALQKLDSLAASLHEMLKAPYGSELKDTLKALQLEAEAAARGCIPGHRFDVFMEDRPDMDVLPLPPV